jgi:hypothetical protein
VVRQIGRSNEWYFCDANGQRVRQEFDKYNDHERDFREKRERGE